MMRAEPAKLVQTRTDLLARDLLRIGLYRYALGYPIEQVREAFAEFTSAWLRVVRLRGTMDYSTTNSWRCFEGVCIALTAGEYATADQLANLIWDPPDASYLGPRSEVCTLGQQHVAYAVKHLFQDHGEEAEGQLKQVRPGKLDGQILFVAKAVRGLLQRNDALFNEGLLELLFWHAKQVRALRRRNATDRYFPSDPDLYFCLAAVGLSIFAVRRQFLPKSGLPEDTYLPGELMPDS
jgi:hypothetical protein